MVDEIITVSSKQVVKYGWHAGDGRVRIKADPRSKFPFIVDRIVGLWGRFGYDKVTRKMGPLRGRDAEPWIYFERAGKKYKTPLYIKR